MPSASCKTYIRRQMYTVPGFLSGFDAAIISLLLDRQEEQGITGHLCEIGVHHGRLLLLLALYRRAAEAALAIDLFTDDALNTGVHRGREGALLRHARRLNIALSDSEVLKKSSLELSAEDILRRVGGPIRFFSVDGGHRYEHVENDLKLARQCMAPKGIIAVDDFFNRNWPEVSLAALDFLRSQSEFVPFMASPGKLYVARANQAPALLQDMLQRPPAGCKVDFPAEFLGSQFVILRTSPLSKIRYKLRARLYRCVPPPPYKPQMLFPH